MLRVLHEEDMMPEVGPRQEEINPREAVREGWGGRSWRFWWQVSVS